MMPIEEEGPVLTDPRADPRILRGAAAEEFGGDAGADYGADEDNENEKNAVPMRKNGKQKAENRA